MLALVAWLVVVAAPDGGSGPLLVAQASGQTTVTPGALVSTGDGFILAWMTGDPRGFTECHLTRLDAHGEPVVTKKVAAEGCEGPRAAWSGHTLAVAYRYTVATREGLPDRGGFQRYSPALEPLGPTVEVVSEPEQWGTITWNPRAEEFAVGWGAFAPHPGTTRFVRFSADGKRLGEVELARGVEQGQSRAAPLLYDLAPSGTGYRAVIGSPLRLFAWDSKGVRQLALLDADGHHATLRVNGETTWVAWQAKASTLVRWARFEGTRQKEKGVLRELSPDFGTGWLSLHCGGAMPSLLWHEHHADGADARVFVSPLAADAKPRRLDEANDDAGAQHFPLAVCLQDGRLAAVWGRAEGKRTTRLFFSLPAAR
jgi:hypothetical protein